MHTIMAIDRGIAGIFEGGCWIFYFWKNQWIITFVLNCYTFIGIKIDFATSLQHSIKKIIFWF